MPPQLPEQPAEFDFGAAVLHDLHAGCLRSLRGCLMPHAELHPYHLRPNARSLISHLCGGLAGAEYLHHVGDHWQVSK